MNALKIKNGACVALDSIPVLPYSEFCDSIVAALGDEHWHCMQYFAQPLPEARRRLFVCLADDATGDFYLMSSLVAADVELQPLGDRLPCMQPFERAMNHPDYPFEESTLASTRAEHLHEVGVGPIHAGIIEPGHFRFTCDGEKVLRLDIRLGYQHRGVEQCMLQQTKLVQRSVLVESACGDSAAAYSTAFAMVWEGLCGFKPSRRQQLERCLATELERIAIHTGDLSAICGDVAYQLGNAVFGRLRTPIINFMQEWCGNRLGKGCLRPGCSPYPFTPALADRLLQILDRYERDFQEMVRKANSLPSVLSRLERTGVLSAGQALECGAVGMAARASGLARDIRSSHPYYLYPELQHQCITRDTGDVYARFKIRRHDIEQSLGYVRQLAGWLKAEPAAAAPCASLLPQANSFCLAATEGWRGAVCHCAISDAQGQLALYKMVDPSLHNWKCLALAVAGNEISDFPICNKSFNLSYCGNDL